MLIGTEDEGKVMMEIKEMIGKFKFALHWC